MFRGSLNLATTAHWRGGRNCANQWRTMVKHFTLTLLASAGESGLGLPFASSDPLLVGSSGISRLVHKPEISRSIFCPFEHTPIAEVMRIQPPVDDLICLLSHLLQRRSRVRSISIGRLNHNVPTLFAVPNSLDFGPGIASRSSHRPIKTWAAALASCANVASSECKPVISNWI